MNLSNSRDYLFRAKAHIASALALLEEKEKPTLKYKWVLKDKQHMCEPVYCISSFSYATIEEAVEEIEKFGLFKVVGRLEE